MEKTAKYVVLHPTRHDGIPHPRGAVLDLNEKEALRLIRLGSIKAADVIVLQTAAGPTTAETVASLNKLNKLTIPELLEYAQTTYGLTLPSDDRKEALVAAIHDRYVASYVPAAV